MPTSHSQAAGGSRLLALLLAMIHALNLVRLLQRWISNSLTILRKRFLFRQSCQYFVRDLPRYLLPFGFRDGVDVEKLRVFLVDGEGIELTQLPLVD